jgi:predicted AAA+ superfamily ATPase
LFTLAPFIALAKSEVAFVESNRTRIGKGFELLLGVLAPYVAAELKSAKGEKWWLEGVIAKFDLDRQKDLQFSASNDNDLISKIDIKLGLSLIALNWSDVFSKKLSKECRNWVDELSDFWRNWTQEGAAEFDDNLTFRALDAMALLGERMAPNQVEAIRILQRVARYGDPAGSRLYQGPTSSPANAEEPTYSSAKAEETSSSASTDGPTSSSASTEGRTQTLEVLKAAPDPTCLGWREVVWPHPDVSGGLYKTAEFAADLFQVANGQGAFEYQDPVEFFARTYMTEGIKGLLVEALKRVTDQQGEPIIQLKTAFGGGKTHSMLALYHLLRGRMSLESVPSLKPVLDLVGLTSPPLAKVAVIVGTALDPVSPNHYDHLPDTPIKTIWGEIGAQLSLEAGRPELYDLVREADQKSVAPGAETLRKLFDEAGQGLILLDELVAYGRRLYGASGLAAGTFENFITFIQALTEGVKQSKNSLLVATLPESDLEIGGVAGKKTLETFEHVFGRVQSIWKPVAASEGFEVVRRRLFLDCKLPAERDKVCARFAKFYHENRGDFPPFASEPAYVERIRACYPIHPEVFDRLYDDWATLDRFQRTRGVLRLMAGVIHELWIANDPSLLIMPGSLPFNKPAVRDELTRYLPDTWNTVVDRDVDGPGSEPYLMDAANPRYGQLMAARRVARTIMLGSAPNSESVEGGGGDSSKSRPRGIHRVRVILGAVQPKEGISIFRDALNTLENQLTYLYSTSDVFWYDTRRTLRKIMEEKAAQTPEYEVEDELEKRLGKLRKYPPLSPVFICPRESKPVHDEARARLVILHYKDYFTNSEPSDSGRAVAMALKILTTCGQAARYNQNMLIFLAAEKEASLALQGSTRIYLAWKSIKDNQDAFDLGPAQTRELDYSVKRSDETVDLQIKTAYCCLFIPLSSVNESISDEINKHAIRFDRHRLDGLDEPLMLKIVKTVRNSAFVMENWAPEPLLFEIQKVVWKTEEPIRISKVWDCLRGYCYLPRLLDYSVLAGAIRRGIYEGVFGYAEEVKDGEVVGLKFKKDLPEFSEDGYLVAAAEALKLVAATESLVEKPKTLEPYDKPEVATSKPVSPPEPRPTRFNMSAELDKVRVISEIQTIIKEILSNIESSPNVTIKLTFEVEADCPKGFDSQTVKSVLENCKVLKVKEYHFDN